MPFELSQLSLCCDSKSKQKLYNENRKTYETLTNMWFRQVLRLQSISRQNFRVQVKYEIHLCPILSASAPARSRKNGYYEILGVSANSRNGDIKVKLVSVELNHNGVTTRLFPMEKYL